MPPAFLGLLLAFAVCASAGHDLWSATLVTLSVLGGAAWLFCRGAGPGLRRDLAWPLGGVLAVFSLSFLGAVNPSESFQRLLDCAAAAGVFWLGLHAFEDDKAPERFLAALVPVLWLQLVLVAYQRVDIILKSAPPAAGFHWDRATLMFVMAPQVPGTMVNSNALAALLLAFLPPLAWEGAAEFKRGRPGFFSSGFLAASTALLSLNSTWALVCLLGAAPFFAGPRRLWALLRRWPRASMSAAAAGAAFVGLMLWWKFTHLYNFAGERLPPGETSARLYWWASAWRMWRDHPWLGVGLGNFPSAYLAYKVGTVQNTLFSHGFLAGLASETGSLGLAASGIISLSWMGRLWAVRGDAERRWPFILGLALLLAFSSISLSLEYLANLMILALFAAIPLAPFPAGRRWKPGRLAAFAAGAAALAAVPFLLAPLAASRLCVAGLRSLAEGDAEQALRSYSSAAALDPRSWDAERGQAAALRAQGPAGLAEALRHQERAAELNSLSGQLRWELGRILLDAGRPEEALAAYEKACALNPASARFRLDCDQLRARLETASARAKR